jgi:hypothetical protein
MNFKLVPVGLKKLSPYLSIHIKANLIRSQMHHGHFSEIGLGLQGGDEIELDLAFSCCEHTNFYSLIYWTFPSP